MSFLTLFQLFRCATQGILIPVLLSAATFNQARPARPKNRFTWRGWLLRSKACLSFGPNLMMISLLVTWEAWPKSVDCLEVGLFEYLLTQSTYTSFSGFLGLTAMFVFWQTLTFASLWFLCFSFKATCAPLQWNLIASSAIPLLSKRCSYHLLSCLTWVQVFSTCLLHTSWPLHFCFKSELLHCFGNF